MGDVHGQFWDLVHILEICGVPRPQWDAVSDAGHGHQDLCFSCGDARQEDLRSRWGLHEEILLHIQNIRLRARTCRVSMCNCIVLR